MSMYRQCWILGHSLTVLVINLLGPVSLDEPWLGNRLWPRVTNHPGLRGTCPILTLKVLHLGKPHSPWHTRTVSHLSLVPRQRAVLSSRPSQPLWSPCSSAFPVGLVTLPSIPHKPLSSFSDTAYTWGDAGMLKNRVTLCYSLCHLFSASGMKAVRWLLVSGRNWREVLSLHRQGVGSTELRTYLFLPPHFWNASLETDSKACALVLSTLKSPQLWI